MTAIATAIPAGTYTSDPVHSTAAFAVKHMLATFRGSFATLNADLTVDEDGRARLLGTVPVGSVVVKDENLAAHLQSPEFFDGEQHPEIRFESSEIAVDGTSATLTGDLTIKGHTERVTAEGSVVGPTEDPFGNTKLALQFETVVDRTKFGLNWNAPLPKGGFMLANDVTLAVDLELLQG
ncbi:MAG TPA: YceI family protein [Solirubrobacteraceae bacterium]|nr:YceI family protein [Solirubrobacteraceae bacterium]